MGQPSDDPRVTTARAILDETRRLHTHGATRADLLYYLGRLQEAARLALDVAAEPRREPTIPDTGHTFASRDGENYRCGRCGRVTDHESVYYLSVFEECGGEGQ